MTNRHRVRLSTDNLALAVTPWVAIACAIVVLTTLALLAFCSPGDDRSTRPGTDGIAAPWPGYTTEVPASVAAAAPSSPALAAYPAPVRNTGTAVTQAPSTPVRARTAAPPGATTATGTPRPAATARNAYATIQAESFDARSGVAVESCNEGGSDITGIGSGDWVRYDDVDFGSAKPLDFVARVASGVTGGGSGLVQVRLDSPTATPIGDFAIDNTGGWQSWRSVPGNAAGVTGRRTVYLTFSSAVSSDFVAVNWFYFRT